MRKYMKVYATMHITDMKHTKQVDLVLYVNLLLKYVLHKLYAI